jgi:hypothetical protein
VGQAVWAEISSTRFLDAFFFRVFGAHIQKKKKMKFLLLALLCSGAAASAFDPIDITKCQNYTVVAGDTCSKIAAKFG